MKPISSVSAAAVVVVVVVVLMAAIGSADGARTWFTWGSVSYAPNCEFAIAGSSLAKYSGQATLQRCMQSCVNDARCAYFNWSQVGAACFTLSGAAGRLVEQNSAPANGYYCGGISGRITASSG